jgi:hypothetical protein
MSTACDITILGDTRVGMLPRIPTRLEIVRVYHEALGLEWSEPDDDGHSKAIQAHPPQTTMILLTTAAAVGACWGADASWPSLTATGYDVAAYGEGVLDDLYRTRGMSVTAEVLREGQRLIVEMQRDMSQFWKEVATEAGNTKGQPGTSIAG